MENYEIPSNLVKVTILLKFSCENTVVHLMASAPSVLNLLNSIILLIFFLQEHHTENYEIPPELVKVAILIQISSENDVS